MEQVTVNGIELSLGEYTVSNGLRRRRFLLNGSLWDVAVDPGHRSKRVDLDKYWEEYKSFSAPEQVAAEEPVYLQLRTQAVE